MTGTGRKERSEFAAVMMLEFPAAQSDWFDRLMTLAREHGRLQELACSQEMPDDYDTEIEAQIRDLCERVIGCRVKFGGDPRGYTVKVFLPSGRYNTWGGESEGWGVPQ